MLIAHNDNAAVTKKGMLRTTNRQINELTKPIKIDKQIEQE